MEESLLQRIRRWMCRRWGHKPCMDAKGEIEVCVRCGNLLSTPYSRGQVESWVDPALGHEVWCNLRFPATMGTSEDRCDCGGDRG